MTLSTLSVISRSRCDVWFEQRSDIANVESLTRDLIKQASKFGGWDHIAQGVLDLAMALLATTSSTAAGRGG